MSTFGNVVYKNLKMRSARIGSCSGMFFQELSKFALEDQRNSRSNSFLTICDIRVITVIRGWALVVN